MDVPCVLDDGDCDSAKWVIFISHVGPTPCDSTDALASVCDVHQIMAEESFRQPVPHLCVGCGIEIRLVGVDPL